MRSGLLKIIVRGGAAIVLLPLSVLGGPSRSAVHGVNAQSSDGTVNCDVDPSQIPNSVEELRFLELANAYRAQYGTPPLQPVDSLNRGALWKATNMAAQQYLAHDDADRPWYQRFFDCGYSGSAGAFIAEDLDRGTFLSTAEAALVLWQNSPVHNANLLNPTYQYVGIKRVQSPHPGDIYAWYWALSLANEPGGDPGQ